jgi:hypothetical protein
MTAKEIGTALFREQLAEDAFFYDPCAANEKQWHEASNLVDRAIREAA